MASKFISVRIKKIRTMSDAANATRHGKREKGSFARSAVDLERSHLNMHFAFDVDAQEMEQVDTCPDYGKALEARRGQLGASRAKNSSVGTEMLFTCSPGILKDAEGNVDLDKSRQFVKDCIAMAEKKYPGMCVAARGDLDETTPHVSVFILPVYEKTYSGEKRQSKRKPRKSVSHNKVFGGRSDMSLLQDWMADGLVEKGWNVERGIPLAITRAKNFQPDGQIYNHLVKWFDKLKTRESQIKKREKHVKGMYDIIRDMSLGLEEHRSLLTKPMLRALEWIKARPEISHPAAHQSQPTGTADQDLLAQVDEEETPQTPEAPSPAPPKP